MKKLFQCICALTVTAILASSCHNNIYEMINQEVKLETNGIRGDINNIVRFKEHIYCSNGRLYQKDAVASSENKKYNEQWSRATTEGFPSGNTAPYIAADANYLYAIVITWKTDNDGENVQATRDIYCTEDGSEWKKVDLSDLIGENPVISDNKSSVQLILSLNPSEDGKSGKKQAFAVLGKKNGSSMEYGIYQLNGTELPTKISEGKEAHIDGDLPKYVASYKDKLYFSTNPILEGADKGNGEESDSYLYYASGSTLYFADDWNKFANLKNLSGVDVGETIQSLALTKDTIVVGTGNGLKHVSIDKEPGKLGDPIQFKNSASVSSSYSVPVVFVLDSSESEENTDIYMALTARSSSSSHALFDDMGLYSYYPDRGTWNKDGTDDDDSKGN